ncbi:cyclophilin-like fold protein [Parabacteroides sp. AGMB00274]|uniref:Cyclophilin-like fold protein n=1 Tax=Parabacteroides faecalis TaxID=2924040 RepID=A0ABT0C558_9BACT|nr:cyclophilin-like fold protein [Parabacteroides faecalis]MCI7286758.1 cyclophilin-like fold protein [Parabacteroides sp.]MCJ2382148.1 cyclophilin-like fold protein [Parabacteroides faecalis]MDY6254820.1 cyclophilin-like fold protein [Bacteroidales bacterium]
MKRLFLILLYFVMIYVAAYGSNENTIVFGQHEQVTGEDYNEKEKINMENNIIKLTINGRSFTVTLVKNSSTDALKEKLTKGNISIRMNDYGNMEKVGLLGFSLPRNDRHTTTSPGDLILYQGNSLVIYYDTNTWKFTRLGHVDGVSTREKMLELLGGMGEITLTLSLNKIQDEK